VSERQRASALPTLSDVRVGSGVEGSSLSAAPAPAPTTVALLGERSLAPRAERAITSSSATVQRLAGEPAPAVPTRTPLASPPSSPFASSGGAVAAFAGRSPGSWVDAGTVAIEAGVAQREADGSVVFDTASFGGAEPDVDVDAGDGPTVQRAGATATAASAPGPPAPAGAAGGDLDELAKRLYGRLRVMLKHELRLDRERAGVLTQGRR
jgi:hypothetical protein